MEIIGPLMAKKHHLRTQNDPKVEDLKNCKYKNCKDGEPCIVGGRGGWLSKSTWINPPPLGINGPNCIKFHHYMGKSLMKLTIGEPLSLVKKLSNFDNLIEWWDPFVFVSMI
jgi:hypothetical protein